LKSDALKMDLQFIRLTEKDFPVVKEIYDFYALNSTATYHTQPVPIDLLRETIPVNHPWYKSYLLKERDKICGYAFFARYKNRSAYDRTAEVTVYLKSEYTGRGIGKIALKRLEDDAGKTGVIKVLVGIVSADNIGSIKLFEKAGYEKCAHFKEVGEKFGKILDVVAYQKILKNQPDF